MEITKIFTFDAAHHLSRNDWSVEKNMNVYGKCSRNHGHLFTLYITIEGSVADDGMVINFNSLKQVVQPIIEILDHSCLNDVVELPTCERMLQWILEKIHPVLPKETKLKRLKLYETPTSYAELVY